MSYTLFIVLSVLAFAVFRLRNVGRRPKDFPPGPPTLPLIGNIHQIPKTNPHHQFKKWAEEYGPVYSLVLGTTVTVVLSSDQAVKDLLDKRSAIYSSRPDMYLASEVASGGLRMLLMPYGERWRGIRKLMHAPLNINVAKSYVPYQDLENKQMLTGFLDQPGDFIAHIRRYTNSLSTQMFFGFRTVRNDDPRLAELYYHVDMWSQVVTSLMSNVINLYPIFKHVPESLIPMRRHARNLFKSNLDLYRSHWLEAKNAAQTGTLKPCVSYDLVQSQKEYGFDDDAASFIVGSLLEAGSDTTASTLVAFMQAMLIYPEVQQRAREEVDRVCGDARLPTIDDDLPYIRACIKESLRWLPTAILGVPHSAVQDDEYMGYRIPKGTSVMLNVWAINMDAKRHEDPRAFEPARYLGDDTTSFESATSAEAGRRDHFVFGAGRRLCQGTHVADRSLFLAISRLVWAFRMERPVGADGDPIVPDPDAITQGVLVQPMPFPARITPRSERHAEVIRSAWEESQRDMLDEAKQWKKVPEGMAFARASYETVGADVKI